jgi:hypothetical protein
MSQPRFTVYEAVNDTLREVYVGMSSAGMHHVMTRRGHARPPAIHHWQPDHAVSYRSVEFSLAASYAVDFVAAHAKTLARPGWTVLSG